MSLLALKAFTGSSRLSWLIEDLLTGTVQTDDRLATEYSSLLPQKQVPNSTYVARKRETRMERTSPVFVSLTETAYHGGFAASKLAKRVGNLVVSSRLAEGHGKTIEIPVEVVLKVAQVK